MTLIKILCSRTYPILQNSRKSATEISYITNYVQRSRTFAKSPAVRSPFKSNKSNDLFGGKLPAPVGEPVYESSLLKQLLFTAGFSATAFVGVTIWEYERYRSTFKSKRNEVISELKTAWNRLTPGDKFFAPICALNLIVFGLWRIPSMKGLMYRYFCANPVSKVTCWPMALSTFSHYSLFHIFANMYVLHSFSNSITRSLGIEQATGVYLTAGVVSSLVSYLYKRGVGVPGYSLGASGAIMAVLSYVCTQYPDQQVNIIFLQMFPFSADSAIKAIIAFDVAGCVLGWKYFDHAAHLGGALFGIFWCYYGREIWSQRKVVMQKWHEFRSN